MTRVSGRGLVPRTASGDPSQLTQIVAAMLVEPVTTPGR